MVSDGYKIRLALPRGCLAASVLSAAGCVEETLLTC
jgi:hypothetical protein